MAVGFDLQREAPLAASHQLGIGPGTPLCTPMMGAAPLGTRPWWVRLSLTRAPPIGGARVNDQRSPKFEAAAMASN